MSGRRAVGLAPYFRNPVQGGNGEGISVPSRMANPGRQGPNAGDPFLAGVVSAQTNKVEAASVGQSEFRNYSRGTIPTGNLLNDQYDVEAAQEGSTGLVGDGIPAGVWPAMPNPSFRRDQK